MWWMPYVVFGLIGLSLAMGLFTGWLDHMPEPDPSEFP